MRRVAAILGSVVVSLTVWGVAIEPRLIDERRFDAAVDGLPPSWEGRTIALFADLQIGMWLDNESTVRRVVSRVVAARPAIVLIAGDFIYEPTDEAGEPKEAVAELESEDARRARRLLREAVALVQPIVDHGIPTYAVLGNHDYAMQWPDSLPLSWIADELESALEGAGIRVLRNEALPLRSDPSNAAEALYLVGIDAEYPRRARPREAVAAVPEGAPRIVLMHNPASFVHLPARSAPLALAAHTHGGQVRIPFVPRWSWLTLVSDEPIRTDGWIGRSFGAAGNRLYVNVGIGFSLLPIRINCRPELTYFTLRGR
jgi:predicted MPP superfamily phosphohydrolase